MADVFSKVARSAIMSRVKGKDTVPEIAVRKIAFGLGYRYRLHCAHLPGKPDLVFPRLHKVILVHGCFWHRHNCTNATTPSSNIKYWLQKFAKNVERDKRNLRKLKRLGWGRLVIWECQMKNHGRVTDRIQRFLSQDSRIRS